LSIAFCTFDCATPRLERWDERVRTDFHPQAWARLEAMKRTFVQRTELLLEPGDDQAVPEVR
jgi:hypothetical protein